MQNINADLLSQMVTNKGNDLATLSSQQPILLIFLRHFGCNFCRDGLKELSGKRADIENAGTKIVFVHLGTDNIAEKYFRRFKLQGIEHIADPALRFYEQFGLQRGSFSQLFGLNIFMKGVKTLIEHGVNPFMGDGLQLPGVFLLHGGELLYSYLHHDIADQPDYSQILQCCKIGH